MPNDFERGEIIMEKSKRVLSHGKVVQGHIRSAGKQLEGIENGIRSSRNVFNSAVNDYNVKVRSFPMNLLAGVFGFKAKEGFKADPGSEKAPEVKF